MHTKLFERHIKELCGGFTSHIKHKDRCSNTLKVMQGYNGPSIALSNESREASRQHTYDLSSGLAPEVNEDRYM